MNIKHVLVVDDSKTERLYLGEILRRNGFIVDTAKDVGEARKSLSETRPDLIIMDVVMPGGSGFGLTRRLSRDPQFSKIPIVICSSKDLETDRIWGLRQGAKAYLVKPVKEAELLFQISLLDDE